MAKLPCSSGTITRPRGRPSSAIAAQIDQEILQAARRMFLTHGFERTSMEMVTEVAGVSKTTLYARHANKAALFRATVLFTIERIANQSLSPGVRETEDLAKGLHIFGCNAVRIALSPMWSGYERLIYSEGPRFPELGKSLSERVDVAVRTVSAFMRECAERDSIRMRDATSVATTYVMALRGYYTAAVLRGDTPTPHQIATFVNDLVRLLLAARTSW